MQGLIPYLAAISTCIPCAVWAAEEPKPPEPATASGTVLVITANKRQQELSDLTRPLHLHTAEEIRRSADDDIAQRWLRTPNVSQPMDHRNGLISVRGIGSGQGTLSGGEEKPALGQQSAVALLIDGVPVDGGWGLRAFGEPIDIEQVELVPGPQGSLHGRNALGAAVQQLGQRGSPAPTVDAQATAGMQGWRLGVAGGGPIGDEARGRAALHYRDDFGSIDNVTTGEDGSDEMQRFDARIAADVDVGERASLHISARHSNIDGRSDWWVPLERADERESISDHVGDNRTVASLIGINGSWQEDEIQRFVVHVGAYGIEDEIDYDSDRTAEDLLVTRGRNNVDGLSADVRWILDHDWMLWQWGGFAAIDNYQYRGHSSADDRPVPALGGLPFHALVGGEEIHHDSSSDVEQLALYMDGSIELPHDIGLEFSLRLGRDAVDYRWRKRSENVYAPGIGFIPEFVEGIDDHRSDWSILPRAAFWWEAIPDHRLFLSYSEGHRAGGFNGAANTLDGASQSFDPDRSRQLELGARGQHENWGLDYEASIFHTWWLDQQVTENTSEIDFIRRNAERSTILGMEASLRWQAHRDLLCWGSVGWLRSRFDERDPGVFTSLVDNSQTITDYEGKQFARVPASTWNIGARYQHERGFYAQAELLGQGSMYLDDANSQKVDGQVLIDAMLGWRNLDWDLRLIGRNLSDETVISDSIDLPGFPGITGPGTWVKLAPPLALSLAIDYRW